MSFDQALDYANRVYLANRQEFEHGGAIPSFPSNSDQPKKAPENKKLAARHFNQWPGGKVFQPPKLKWTEHRGANP